jgi:hypothetical protein
MRSGRAPAHESSALWARFGCRHPPREANGYAREPDVSLRSARAHARALVRTAAHWPLEAIAGSESFEDPRHRAIAFRVAQTSLALSAMTRSSSSRRTKQCGAGLAASQRHGQMCPRRVLHSITNVTRAVGNDAVGASRREGATPLRFQEQLLHRPVDGPVDGADTTGAGECALEAGSEGDGRRYDTMPREEARCRPRAGPARDRPASRSRA